MTDAEGHTALMLTAFNGHDAAVRLLVERGADVHMTDGDGRTALMYAATTPYDSTVRFLLEKGAKVDSREKTEQWTALMFAAGEGHVAVVRTLLKHGADPLLIDGDGDRAIDFAMQRGHRKVVQILTEAMKK